MAGQMGLQETEIENERFSTIMLLQVWPVVHQTLNAKGLKSVTPQEAQNLMKKGWKLVSPT